MRPRYLQSAGGVLITLVAETPYTVVLHRRDPDEWRLPKGKLRAGETLRQAAVREVAEETGITAEAHDLLGQTEYEYLQPRTGELVHKRVTFYLMPLPRQQPIKVEGKTFYEGLWMPVVEAESFLTFAAERNMVRQAGARIAQ